MALELFKQGRQIAYQQNNGECDFVVIDKDRLVEAIQVSFDLSDPETKKRELKGLIQACQKFNLKQGTIITFDLTGKFVSQGIKVSLIPAWKRFLEQ